MTNKINIIQKYQTRNKIASIKIVSYNLVRVAEIGGKIFHTRLYPPFVSLYDRYLNYFLQGKLKDVVKAGNLEQAWALNLYVRKVEL